MAADEKTEREQYLKELARLKSLRSKQNDEKKDAADTAASLPVSGKDTKNPERTVGTRQESNLTLQRLRDAALAESPTKEAETPLQRMRDAAAKESAKREADSTFERLKAEALLQKQAERAARTEEKASMEVVADPEEEDVETDSEDALSNMQHRAESLLAGFRKPKRETKDELPEAEADEPEGRDVMAKSATRSSRNKNSRDSNAARRKTAKPAAGAGEKKKKKKKGKKSPILIFIALLSCFLVVWGAKNLLLGQKTHASGYYTVAVFGVDSRNGNLGKDALSDVNMLVSLNKETGDIRICSIYRDTFMQIDKSGKHHKFNEAYFKGGPEQALWMIRYNLDIQPDDYITFNWKAVVDAVNIMGGVDIEITPAEFKYINSFITETVKSTGIGSVQLTHPGMNHLDGVQAVAYARLRLMDTDYNRTERQRKVVSLLMDKIRAADTAKRIELVTSVLPETKTSMGLDDVLAYAKDIKKYHIAETSGFPFERDAIWIEKKDCVVPITLESNVISLHQFLFQEENYQPSASVREVSDYIVKKSGLKGKGKSAEIQTDKPGAVGNTGEVKEKNKKSSTTEQAAEEKGSKSSSAAAESSAAETSSAASTEAETTVATTESTKKKHSEAASKTSESIEESSAGKVKPKSSEKDNESVVGPGASIRETKESATSAAETEVVGPGAGLPAN
jgi:cell envelope-related transcriptional attenuator